MKFSTTAVGLLVSAGSVLGASLQQVSNFGTAPKTSQMYIYVPDKVAANPAIIVAVRIISHLSLGTFIMFPQ
jgi:hypothetical protein